MLLFALAAALPSLLAAASVVVPVTGCLSYKNGACNFCDQANWYFIVGSSCQLMKIDNCLGSYNGQICYACVTEFFPDLDTGACIRVPAVIKNCVTYSDATTCQTCKTGFYVSGGACEPTDVTIPGCSVYKDGLTCLSCATGFLKTPGLLLPSKDGYLTSANFCQNFTLPHCQSGGLLSCVQCRDGFKFFANNYLNTIKGLSTVSLKRFDMTAVAKSLGASYSVCAPLSVPHCLVYQEFYSCLTCETGYFVNAAGACQVVPDSIIVNCFEYKSTGVCRQCLQGFYLDSPSSCLAHTVSIPNCLTMSPDVRNTCDECADGYFLTSNTCVLRSVKIPNCLTYSVTAEVCDQCAPSYLLAQDSSQCFASLPNCYQYTFAPNGVTCLHCNSGMYFDSLLGCIKVPNSIDGCLFYKSLSVANDAGNFYECAICDVRQQLLPGGTCTPFDAYIGRQILCNSTDQTQKNICNGCNAREILSAVDNYCEAVPSVSLDENCIAYNSTGWCVQCGAGFFLANGRCYQVSVLNCKEVTPINSLQCVKCLSSGLFSYFVKSKTTPNKCISTYDHVTQNCVTPDEVVKNDATDQNTLVCNACYSPFYPERFKNAMFCVPVTTLVDNFGEQGSLPTATNCRIWNAAQQKCFNCKFNLTGNYQWVVSNGTCTESCPAKQNIKTQVDPYIFVCGAINAALGNCAREDGAYCVQCEAGLLPEVKPDTNTTSFTHFAFLPVKHTNHFKSKMLSFNSTWNRIFTFQTCTEAKASAGMTHSPTYTNLNGQYPVNIPKEDYAPGTTTVPTTCRGLRVVLINSNNLWGCVTCVFGFSGYFVLDNTQTSQFVPLCSLNFECDYGTFYNGLGLQMNDGWLDFWTSCHKCTNSSKIPTFSRWSRVGVVAAGSTPKSAPVFSPQSGCAPLGFLSTANPYFPAACGVQEVLPDVVAKLYPQSGALTGVNPICWACKPGYKAVFEVTSGYVVSCAKIDHCDLMMGGDTFNKCTYCNTGYALNAAMDTCVATAIANCYMLQTFSAPQKCAQCIFGYVVSRDQSACNAVNIQNCINSELFYLDPADPTGPYLGQGCTRCELGYVSIQMELTQSVCVRNEIFASPSAAPIKNCYSYSSLTTCAQCAVGYILPEGVTNKCIPLGKVANCAVYNADETCKTCQTGYILEAGLCTDGTLYNTNCATFASQTQCSSCKSGFVLVRISLNVVRCFQAATLFRCLAYDPAKSVNGILSCLTCETGYYPKTPSPVVANLKGCLGIPVIPNCATYNMATYRCTRCNDAYYLVLPTAFSGNLLEACVLRTHYPDSACSVMSDTHDSCDTCLNGYYVRDGICQTKPTGVVSCDVYQDASTCLKCTNNTYLAANLCQPVPSANLVPNCRYYRDSATCSECLPSYFLSDNQCLLISVSNCQAYQSPTVCKQCVSGYFLSAAGNCQKPSIVNCLIFGSLNSCQLCATNYYVNTNQACSVVPVAKLIRNCLYYAQNLTCSQCTAGTILSKDATACLNFVIFNDGALELAEQDPNCDAFVYRDTCKNCVGTYQFSNGECVPCNVNLPNCQFCDFNNKTNCIACVPGFSMDLAGACVSNSAREQESQTSTTKSFNYTPTTGFMPAWAMAAQMLPVAAAFALGWAAV